MLREEYDDFVARKTGGKARRRPVMEINEREDGYVDAWAASRYVAEIADWLPCERRALDRVVGATLDVGAGSGRVSIALKDRDVLATALDTSPGAVEVAAKWGVSKTVLGTVGEHASEGVRYDTILLFGNNLGLLESRDRAGKFLAELAAVAAPGARLLGQGNDPYVKKAESHLTYYESNRARGRMTGQWTMRLRHRDLVTDWYEYLNLSSAELEELTFRSPWQVVDIDDKDGAVYFAELRLRS